MMIVPTYRVAEDVLDTLRENLLSGKTPVRYPVGKDELARIELGPGLVVLVGGAPGAGKTAFTMQCVTDALRLTPSLRALVCNVEMSPAVLLERQLARLSGIDLTTIRRRTLGEEHADRVEFGLKTLGSVADRLAFLRPPFTLENVADSADAWRPDLILLDYIQRLVPPGQHDSRRGSVDATMNHLREFADADTAMLVVSAVGRSRDQYGRNTYKGEGLNLASFRESSELEFGADSAWILVPGEDPEEAGVTLKHLKDRYGEMRDIRLQFDRRRQAFCPET